MQAHRWPTLALAGVGWQLSSAVPAALRKRDNDMELGARSAQGRDRSGQTGAVAPRTSQSPLVGWTAAPGLPHRCDGALRGDGIPASQGSRRTVQITPRSGRVPGAD